MITIYCEVKEKLTWWVGGGKGCNFLFVKESRKVHMKCSYQEWLQDECLKRLQWHCRHCSREQGFPGSNLREQLGPRWLIRAQLDGCGLRMVGVPVILVMTLSSAFTKAVICVSSCRSEVNDLHDNFWYVWVHTRTALAIEKMKDLEFSVISDFLHLCHLYTFSD